MGEARLLVSTTRQGEPPGAPHRSSRSRAWSMRSVCGPTGPLDLFGEARASEAPEPDGEGAIVRIDHHEAPAPRGVAGVDHVGGDRRRVGLAEPAGRGVDDGDEAVEDPQEHNGRLERAGMEGDGGPGCGPGRIPVRAAPQSRAAGRRGRTGAWSSWTADAASQRRRTHPRGIRD